MLLDFGDHWAEVINEYNQQFGMSWPFDIADPEGGWDVPGVGTADVEDVIPDSVLYNLELQATASFVFPVPDDDDNHRLDGSVDGIILFESDDEDHLDLPEENSQAMNWTIAKLGELYEP